MSTKQNQTKGFTIIEVVLVLAIAALIFLLVFLALPALQRSRRDTQRRDDISRVLSQVQTWQANNNGQVPGSGDMGTFLSGYMQAGGDAFNDPQTGTTYTMTYKSGAQAAPASTTVGTIFYVQKAKCGGGGATTSSTNNNQVAVVTALEGSGAYCADNS